MDDPGPNNYNIIFEIIILLLLIIINAFFSLAETAIISINENKLEKMAEGGHKRAKKVLKLTSDIEKFIFISQTGITFTGFLVCAFASQSFADRLSAVIAPLLPQSFPLEVLKGIIVILITVISSYIVLLLGKLVPQRIAMQIPEKIAFGTIGTITLASKISKPFVAFLSFSTRFLVKLLGFDPDGANESVTEEEIRMLVDEGEEKGVIENVQKEMINNIFEFDDIDVSDIMTHRTDICAVDVEDSLDDIIKVSVENGYSRIPVYEEDTDNIIGIAYVKDLLPFVGKELPKDKDLRSIMRQPYYIPESKPCGELFTDMNESHVQMAIVVDEYGGTAGLVTLEDLLESIVGNIQDEYDHEDIEISKIDDATFTVDGTTDIDEVADLIGIDFPDDDYDTIGGFIISELGYLPKDGDMDSLDYKNYRFTILNVEDRRIGKIKLEILPKEQSEDEEE
ncbi:MAG: hemolysin family protein [Clostridiales bacterium]|nr:hemolysin family protein [Clostridiales bacterium]